MKLSLAVACLLIPVTCHAEAGMECKKYEYAELKDSSKAELLEIYCTADSRQKFNLNSIREMNNEAPDLIKRGEYLPVMSKIKMELFAAEKVCRATASDAWGMLEKKDKKYRSQQPICK